MPGYTVKVAYGTAIIGYDMFSNQVFARAPQNRAISAFGMTGSAAIGDAEIELMVDEVRIGNYFNTTGGATMPNFDDMVRLENLVIPGGAQIRAVVRDAAATNSLNITVSIEDI